LSGGNPFTGSNDSTVGADASTVTFTVNEPNNPDDNSGSSYTFNVAVTDDNWLTNGEFGNTNDNTSITVIFYQNLTKTLFLLYQFLVIYKQMKLVVDTGRYLIVVTSMQLHVIL
jgi:hypothetical protein